MSFLNFDQSQISLRGIGPSVQEGSLTDLQS